MIAALTAVRRLQGSTRAIRRTFVHLDMHIIAAGSHIGSHIAIGRRTFSNWRPLVQAARSVGKEPDTSDGTSEGTSDSTSEGTSDGTSEGTSEGTSSDSDNEKNGETIVSKKGGSGPRNPEVPKEQVSMETSRDPEFASGLQDSTKQENTRAENHRQEKKEDRKVVQDMAAGKDVTGGAPGTVGSSSRDDSQVHGDDKGTAEKVTYGEAKASRPGDDKGAGSAPDQANKRNPSARAADYSK